MPNEEIDVENLESLEKYCSYTPYLRQAEEAKNKPVWWKTYRSYVEKADPEHGEATAVIPLVVRARHGKMTGEGFYCVTVETSASPSASFVLLQVQSKWTSGCRTIDPAGPKK